MALIILMRHAKAVRDHEAPSDEARGLKDRGRSDAQAAAREILRQGFRAAAILASSAARTAATADIAAREGMGSGRVLLDKTLYLAEPETIWSSARPRLGEDGLLVVGHNPGIHALVADWLRRAGDRSAVARALGEGFPTSAWAAFDVEDEPMESLSPRLLGAWAPKGL